MKLTNKKKLAAKTLGVGKDRIIFNVNRLAEIAEALTKQDIRDLVAQGAISIRPSKGRQVHIGRTRRRRPGSIKKRVKQSKQKYVIITRKLRAYVRELVEHERITPAQYHTFRKEIRAHRYKSKAHFKERENIS